MGDTTIGIQVALEKLRRGDTKAGDELQSTLAYRVSSAAKAPANQP